MTCGPETLGPAVAGVDKISLLTANESTGAQQAINVIAAAKQAGSPHIVRHAAFGSSKSRIVQQYEQVDKALRESGLPFTFVKPTFFMQNILGAAQTVASDGALYMPMKNGRFGTIDIRDIAEAAAAVLTTEGHDGESYYLTGPESISMADIAASLSSALGKQVSYVDVPGEAAKQALLGMGMSEWRADGYGELYEGFAAGFADTTTSNVEKLTGHPARSIDDFARDFESFFQAAA